MTVGVVVPCRNEATTVGRLLDAIASQTHRPDRVVIVDDRSTDQTATVVRAWIAGHPDVAADLVAGPGRGVAAAVNAGIEHLPCDVIVRFDGHSVPQRDYIACALETLGRTSAGVIGGVWTIEPGAPSITARAIAAVVAHPLGSGGARYRNASAPDAAPASVETVPFGVFARSLWRELGGYDESLTANEDFDFNFRARRSGAAVVLDPRLRSTYVARATLGRLARQYHQYGFWKVQMLRKDPRGWHWRQGPPAVVAPWVAVTAVWALLRPTPLAIAASLLYPLLIVMAALHVALRARDVGLLPASCVAFGIVHLSWSAGFWRALAGARPPRSRG